MAHVFISYQHDDVDFAENLKHRVEKAGFDVWMDSDKLSAGEDWREGIDQGIKTASALIVVMTPGAKASEYVTYEWAFAWGAGVPVIPIMLKSTPLHPRLEALQYLDFTNRARPWDGLLARIERLSSGTNEAKTTPAIATPLTDASSTAAPPQPVAAQGSEPGEPALPAYLQKTIAEIDSADANIRGAAIARLAQINLPTARSLFVKVNKAALDSADESERSAALRRLAQADFAEAHDLLAEALNHPLHEMPFQAAVHLARVKDQRALPILLDALQHVDQTRLRTAAYSLKQLGTQAIPSLIDALQQHSIDSRITLVWILGQLKDIRAVPPLIALLVHTTTVSSRISSFYGKPVSVPEAAAEALEHIGTPEALAAVEEWRKQRDSAQPAGENQ